MTPPSDPAERTHSSLQQRLAGPAAFLRGFLLRYWGVIVILVAWELWVTLNSFNSIVMPQPWSVVADIVETPGIYLSNALQTFLLAFLGLVIGMAFGTILAVLAWWSPILGGTLTPLGLVFSSVPVVAIIPVLARLLGYDIRTVLAIVVIITFFPAFVFTASGLRALPQGSSDLFAVLGADRRTLLLRLALPAAVPNWMIALRLCAPQAILGAMVAEFLMGTSGLGYMFISAKNDLDTSRALGASLVATVASVLCFVGAVAAEARVRRRWN